MSVSSGSSLGSLTSTGSHGSQTSIAASLSDIYNDPCHRPAYDLPEIDRDALFQRIERLLNCSEDAARSSPGTAVSQDSVNSLSDAASSVGCLPTYEQHLERQKYRYHTPVQTAQVDPTELTNSLKALGFGPFTSRLIASTSADCWQPPQSETFSDVQPDSHPQSSYTDVDASTTHPAGCVGLGQSDASSGVSAEEAGGSDCVVAGLVNRSASRHVSTGSATESDSGISDAVIQQ